MSIEELSRADLERAIIEGVRQAFATVLNDVDVAGAIRGGANLQRAITEGVRQAFAAVLEDVDIAGAIRGGAKDALDLVFGDQILGAIADGTREALQSGPLRRR